MKKLLIIPVAVLALGAVAWASAYDVRSEIRSYQNRGACQRADLNFDRKVDGVDLKLVQDWFGRSDAPFWFDQDGNGVISIFDISTVAGKVGTSC